MIVFNLQYLKKNTIQIYYIDYKHNCFFKTYCTFLLFVCNLYTITCRRLQKTACFPGWWYLLSTVPLHPRRRHQRHGAGQVDGWAGQLARQYPGKGGILHAGCYGALCQAHSRVQHANCSGLYEEAPATCLPLVDTEEEVGLRCRCTANRSWTHGGESRERNCGDLDRRAQLEDGP